MWISLLHLGWKNLIWPNMLMERMPCYMLGLPSQHPEIALKCKVCCGSSGLGNTLSYSTSSFLFPTRSPVWLDLDFIFTFLQDFCSPGLWEPDDWEFLDTSKEPAYWTTHTWQNLKSTGTKLQILWIFFFIHLITRNSFLKNSFIHCILSSQLFCQMKRCFGILNCRFPLSTEDRGGSFLGDTQTLEDS